MEWMLLMVCIWMDCWAESENTPLWGRTAKQLLKGQRQAQDSHQCLLHIAQADFLFRTNFPHPAPRQAVVLLLSACSSLCTELRPLSKNHSQPSPENICKGPERQARCDKGRLRAVTFLNISPAILRWVHSFLPFLSAQTGIRLPHSAAGRSSARSPAELKLWEGWEHCWNLFVPGRFSGLTSAFTT